MGNEFTFIHCADLHLGSRFVGLADYDRSLAEAMRESVFESFRRIVDAAIENDVDALIISGDVFDDSNELPSTRMRFVEQLSRLDIPVFICRGNHDFRTSWDESIPYPKNVHEFGTEVESVEIGDVQILGVSYSQPHETRNLAQMMNGDPSKFTIACVHCDIDSCSEGYRYAPCTLSDLMGRSVDYWALGHIHKRNVISTSPYIVYPGNIQGRSFKGTGEKGAYLVRVSNGRVSSFEFIATQTYVWNDLTADITDRTLSSITEELSASLNRRSIARIRFTGSGSLDTMLRSKGEDVRKTIANSTGAIVSDIVVDTSPELDIASMSEGKDMRSAVIRSAEALSKMSKKEIIDAICSNKLLSRNRSYFESLDDVQIKALVDTAMKNALIGLEVRR